MSIVLQAVINTLPLEENIKLCKAKLYKYNKINLFNNFSINSNWQEMSYSTYKENILDYNYSEYSNGNWHNSRWQ